MTQKLPKQWLDWVSSANLRVVDQWGKKRGGYYLKGRGFHWRVNCHGEFERGDNYDDFDRWARCRIDSVQLSTIKNREQFVVVVTQLTTSYEISTTD